MQEITDTKIVFGILSSLFVFVGMIPYIRGIQKKKIQPHILSWLGWGFLATLGATAMLSNIFNWGAVFIATNAASCFVIVVYSLVKKVGVWKVSGYDYGLFISGLIGLILWQISSNPDLAIFFTLLADLFFGIPTLIKIYKRSYSETIFPWVVASLAGFCGLLAVSYLSFTEIAYPVYLAIFDFSVLALLLFSRRKFLRKK